VSRRWRHRHSVPGSLSIDTLIGGGGGGDPNHKSINPELVCPTFRSWIDQRRDEAKRSLLVQVRSSESAQDLLNYCQAAYGPVKVMDFHNNPQNPDFPNFFVVEFAREDSVREALSHGGHISKHQGQLSIPVTSPFMWFSGKDANVNKPNHLSPSQQPSHDVPIYVPTLQQLDKSEEALEATMVQHNTMDKQMMAVYQFHKLSGLETKLRFLACQQLELALSGLFPQAEVIPFGSSVNQFGAHTTDLDMIVNFAQVADRSNNISSSRLRFHTKVDHGSGSRSLSRTYCNEIASLVEHFLPGCQDVQRITRARIPIFSYKQNFIGVDVDVSFEASGIFMSELLYLYGELDCRVRPLVFNVRLWAKEQGLISNTRPTRHFKNFQLTLMVIFFLQHKYGMLPSFAELKQKARSGDKVTTSEVDGTFVRDISGLQPVLNKEWHSQPQYLSQEGSAQEPLTLVQMLADFFEFYSTFAFDKHQLCLVSGDVELRTVPGKGGRGSWDNDALHVGNPLQPGLNATDNVSKEMVDHFKVSCSMGLRRLFALNELSDDSAKLKNSKLSYVITTSDPDLKLASIYGMQSLQQQLNTKKLKRTDSQTHRERRKLEQAKGKFLKVPKLKDILVSEK